MANLSTTFLNKSDLRVFCLEYLLLRMCLITRKSMVLFQAQSISKLIKVSGIVIAASRTKAKATYVTLMCKNCKSVKAVPCRPGLGGAVMPRSCDHVAQVSNRTLKIMDLIR